MTLPLIIVLCALTMMTIWGFIAPRSQWRLMSAASRGGGENSRDEAGPGSMIVGIHRTVSGIALVVLILTALPAVTPHAEAEAPVDTPAAVDPITTLWGVPDPVVVNRVFDPALVPPEGFLAGTITRYQAIDGAHRDPNYLFDLDVYQPPSSIKAGALIGSKPPAGLTALDTSNIVISVQGDRRCVLHSVLVVESRLAVVVATYFEPPTQPVKTGSAATTCTPAAGSPDAITILVPIHLTGSVGARSVVQLDGALVPAVR